MEDDEDKRYDINPELAYKLNRIKKISYSDIEKTHKISARTLVRWAKEHEWDERWEKELAIAEYHSITAKTSIMNDSLDTSIVIMDKLVRSLHRMEEEFSDNPLGVVSLNKTIKDYVSSLDKLIRLKMFVQNGGMDKTQVNKNIHIKQEKLDWNMLISQCVNLKKEHGNNFDDMKFVKSAVDAAYKKKD